MLLKKGIFDYLEETGQTHTQNKFIVSLKKYSTKQKQRGYSKMANKFEDMTFDNNDYQVVKNISEDNNTNLGWEKKSKLVFNKKVIQKNQMNQ